MAKHSLTISIQIFDASSFPKYSDKIVFNFYLISVHAKVACLVAVKTRFRLNQCQLPRII